MVAIDPPTSETNLFWNGIGERMPSMQALVGHDPVSGANDNSELARSWEANDEFTEWTFHLHEEAEFHFGWGPVSAHDVVHSYELHIGPDSTILGLEHLRAQEVEALDDHTVVFRFESPRTDYAFHHAAAARWWSTAGRSSTPRASTATSRSRWAPRPTFFIALLAARSGRSSGEFPGDGGVAASGRARSF